MFSRSSWRWKTLLAVVVIMSRASTLFGAEEPASVSPVEQRIKNANHKIIIHPSTPIAGIGTGMVIAYGHPLRPPYKFEYRGNKLFVNDVQIQPSMIREQEDLESKHTNKSIEDTVAKLAPIELEFATLLKKNIPHDAILDQIKLHRDIVKNAKWTGDDNIKVQLIDFPRVWHDLGEPHVYKGTPNSSATPQAEPSLTKENDRRKKNYVAYLNESLGKGKTIIFLSSTGYIVTGNIFGQVRGTLSNPSLPNDQKIKDLRALIPGSITVAYDILNNYSESEWADIK